MGGRLSTPASAAAPTPAVEANGSDEATSNAHEPVLTEQANGSDEGTSNAQEPVVTEQANGSDEGTSNAQEPVVVEQANGSDDGTSNAQERVAEMRERRMSGVMRRKVAKRTMPMPDEEEHLPKAKKQKCQRALTTLISEKKEECVTMPLPRVEASP
jgi:hypothetical protein